MIVHILVAGRALCGRPGLPATWPKNHKWVAGGDARDATCVACLRASQPWKAPDPPPPGAIPDLADATTAAFTMHEQLIAWLLAHHPRTDPLVIVSALSYEIARLVAVLAQHNGTPPAALDAMLESIRMQMREHVQAYLDGKLHISH